MNELNKILEEINELKEAKQLLDDLLVYYSIYGEEFDNDGIKNANVFPNFNGMRGKTFNDRIRGYIKFDDSE